VNEAKEMSREVRKAYGDALVESFPNATIRDPYYLFDAMQDIEAEAVRIQESNANGEVSEASYDAQTDNLERRAAELLGIDPKDVCVTNDPRGNIFSVSTEVAKGMPIRRNFAGYGIPAPNSEQLEDWYQNRQVSREEEQGAQLESDDKVTVNFPPQGGRNWAHPEHSHEILVWCGGGGYVVPNDDDTIEVEGETYRLDFNTIPEEVQQEGGDVEIPLIALGKRQDNGEEEGIKV
jgi:hypothetical protein